MSKLDLNEYPDQDIVQAFFKLPAGKFLSVMNALATVASKMEERGKDLAKDDANDVVDRMIKSLFE